MRSTFLEEDGEAEISGLERGVLVLVKEEKVLGLEVAVHHTHGVAGVHDLHDGPQQGCSSTLGVVAPCDDPVEQLPSRAQLHHQVHRLLVLVRASQLNDVRLPR